MAGLERSEHGQWFLPSFDSSMRPYAYFEDDPALRPYVAELLTAKLLGSSRLVDKCRDLLWRRHGSLAYFATAEQKITAAMAVLSLEAA